MPNMGFRGVYAAANSAIGGKILYGDVLPARRGNFFPSYNYNYLSTSDLYFPHTTLLLKALGSNTQQNYTFLDSSTNNLTLTNGSGVAPQGAFSPYGLDEGSWSANFSGTSRLTTGTSAQFNLNNTNLTLEAWVFMTSAPSVTNRLITIGPNNAQSSLAFSISTSRILDVGVPFGSGGGVNSGANAIPLNQWVHLAFTLSSNVGTIYINGTQVGQSSGWNITSTSSNYFYIGYDTTATVDGKFAGYVSNVRLVRGTAVYTSNFTPPTTPLTAITGTSLLACQSNRFKDNSTNNFAITQNGDVKISAMTPFNQVSPYTTAIYGGSFGEAGYITAASSSAFGFGSGDFTIEFWLYTTVSSWNADDRFISFGATSGHLNLTMKGGIGLVNEAVSHLIQNSGVYPNKGEWNHIAMTRSGTTVRLFKNGVTFANTTTSVGNASGTLNFNALSNYGSNFRIIKGTALYTANFTPPTAPLTAVSNTSLLISTTNAGIADISRKFNLNTAGNAQVSTNVFKYEKSMYFDGTGDYLLIPSASYTDEFLFGSSDFTVETWVRFTALGQNRCFIDAWVSGQSASWQLYYQSSSTKIVWYVGNGVLLTSTTTPLVDTWYHVAVTRSGTTSRMFINGVLESTEPSISPNYNYKAPLALGVQYSTLTNYLNGYMEDTRITRGVARYTASFTPPTAPLPTR